MVISNLVHIPNLKFFMIKGTKTLLILNLMMILILRLFHTTNQPPPHVPHTYKFGPSQGGLCTPEEIDIITVTRLLLIGSVVFSFVCF